MAQATLSCRFAAIHLEAVQANSPVDCLPGRGSPAGERIRPPPPEKDRLLLQSVFFNEARLAAHEVCSANEAMLRIMKLPSEMFGALGFIFAKQMLHDGVAIASFLISKNPTPHIESLRKIPEGFFHSVSGM